MSFGSGGGFGSNTGGFGGFGNNNNNNTTNTSSGSLFGGNTATSGGFGGFGNNNNATTNPFGAPKTGFGTTSTTTGGSLFGGNTNTTGGFGGGGFGANNAATSGATLSTGFGGTTNNNSLFGAAKPTGGFGSTNTAAGGLFGANNTNSGFGGSNTASNPFAATSNTGGSLFGGNNGTTTGGGFGTTNNATNSTFGGFGGNNTTANQGTAGTPFTPVTEKDAGTSGSTSAYQTITMQQPYQTKSLEELRLEDYAQNRRYAQNGSFGASNTFGGFNSANNATANNGNRSLFGGTNTATTGTTGFGGSFGANNTGFGTNTATNNTTTGGLFGAKPATPSLFGNNNATNTTGGFGTANNAGGLFGNNNATAANTSFGGFGATNNNNAASGGLFGNNNNQAKPGFGTGFGTNTNTATTGGGLFGNTASNNQTASTGLFGNTNNTTGGFGTNTGTSLFGNNQQKPATGLFGSTTNNAPATGTGLFGQAAQPAANTGFGGATGGGLFGNTNNNTGGLFGNNQQKPATGLFGSTTNTGTTGGLFGNTNNQSTGLFGNNANAGTSLFNNQPKPAGNSLFGNTNNGGSLFGNNANQGNSLFGNNAAGTNSFGASQGQNAANLFSSMQNQPNQLTASLTGDPYGNAQLFASLASPSPPVGPLATPLSGAKPAPKARASLLASVRGSPMLGANSTPRARQGYGFSYSSYNSPATNTPLLTPGASSLLRPTGSLGSALSNRLAKSFSTSNLRGETGESLIRTPAQGGSLLGGSGSLGSGSIRKLKIDRSLRTDLFSDNKKQDPRPVEDKRVSFDQAVTTDAKPTADNALVVRDEEGSKTPEASALSTVQEDETPRKPTEAGEYWTEPQMKHLQGMSRSQLASLKTFAVGRQGVGKIVFGGPVDLTGIPLEDICGKIVQLKPRSATVYEDDSDKPPVGKGLNLPSTIYLEQSWPRKTRLSGAHQTASAKEVERHKNRLRKVSGTTFVDYNESTGIWAFTVEHFTTYELDDEEETMMQDTTNVVDVTEEDEDKSMGSPEDDTFQFKLERRSQNAMSLPGGFDNSMTNLESERNESADELQVDDQLDGPSDSPATPESLQEMEVDMPGGFEDDIKSILKPAPRSLDLLWEDQLQRTLSPKKRDRQTLKDLQPALTQKTSDPDTLLKKSLLTRSQLGQAKSSNEPSQAFKTSMDIMKSLWADSKPAAGGLLEASRAINRARSSRHSTDGGNVFNTSKARASRGARQAMLDDVNGAAFAIQRDSQHTEISLDEDAMEEEEDGPVLPEVLTRAIPFAVLAKAADSNSRRETDIWRICSALFDEPAQACPEIVRGMTEELMLEHAERIRTEAFLQVWDSLHSIEEQLNRAPSSEATAIYHLTVGNTLAATQALSEAGNHKLSVLIAQGGSQDIAKQIEIWRQRKDWSEFSEGQRALWTILSGEVYNVAGVVGAREDHVDSFSISDKYDLSWKQLFGLQIRYGKAETFEQAIESFVEHSNETDVLLSLLKIITEQVDPAQLFDNKLVTGQSDSELYRLTWQLATLLSARGNVRPDDDAMDEFTINFAQELESVGPGRLTDSIWVLLHLNDEDVRLTKVKEVLERNSDKLDETAFETLTKELQIPPSMFYAAKAAYARDPWAQVEYLLQAADHACAVEAHNVLCKVLGPKAVIEQEYEPLEKVCQSLGAYASHLEDWRVGGEVYLHFSQFMLNDNKGSLKKLDKSLQSMEEEGEDGLSLEMKVARREMRKAARGRASATTDAYKSMRHDQTRSKGKIMLERYMHALGEVV